MTILELFDAFENALSEKLRGELKQLGNGWAMMADQYAFRDAHDADRAWEICLAVTKEVLPTPCYSGDGELVDGGRDLPQMAILLKCQVEGGGDTVHHVYLIYPTNYYCRRVSLRVEGSVLKTLQQYHGQRQLLTDPGKRSLLKLLPCKVQACVVAHT